MVDFTLSEQEQETRVLAQSFAEKYLAPARAAYSAISSPAERFQSTEPIYRAAVAAGLIRAQIPSPVGGDCDNLVAAAILVEEFYAIEQGGAALTIFGTGLGLTPLALAFRPELQEFLDPFLKKEGAPMASLVYSEPGGVANWLEDGAPGLRTTAKLEGEEWILNGEKIWATNSAGFDFKGPELSCVVCRCINEDVEASAKSQEDKVMILLVTRNDIERSGNACFQVLGHPQTMGHTAVSGPHIKYTNIRVPAKNLLCPPGTGAAIVTHSFEISAMLVGAMGTGIQRAAFDHALAYSRSQTRGGTVRIGERQSVADLLINIKMRTETSRYLTWKAAHCLHSGPGEHKDRRELAIEAKIYCSDTAVQSCTDAINLVGISAYDVKMPFSNLLNDAMVLPIFDGGNIGIRRRALQQIFMSDGYESWVASFGKAK